MFILEAEAKSHKTHVYPVCYDAEATSEAGEGSVTLDQLAERRKRRQYSAINVSSNVLASSSATHCSTTDVADHNAKPKRVQSAQVWCRESSSTTVRRKESNPIDVGEYGDSADPKRVQHRRREVTGDCGDSENLKTVWDSENPKRAHRRMSHSGAGNVGDTAGMSYYESQRSMIEQSRALLEQSKAKHHALVAKAHSMQKELRRHQLSEPTLQQSDSQTALAPKPPTAPPADRKPTSTFRTQRLTRYDE